MLARRPNVQMSPGCSRVPHLRHVLSCCHVARTNQGTYGHFVRDITCPCPVRTLPLSPLGGLERVLPSAQSGSRQTGEVTHTTRISRSQDEIQFNSQVSSIPACRFLTIVVSHKMSHAALPARVSKMRHRAKNTKQLADDCSTCLLFGRKFGDSTVP